MFATGSAKLPRNGTRYLRRLRELIAGAARITCTGHTDNGGSTAVNKRLGLAPAPRPSATSSYADTDIRTRVRSRGETDPRAPNTTSKGRPATAT